MITSGHISFNVKPMFASIFSIFLLCIDVSNGLAPTHSNAFDKKSSPSTLSWQRTLARAVGTVVVAGGGFIGGGMVGGGGGGGGGGGWNSGGGGNPGNFGSGELKSL